MSDKELILQSLEPLFKEAEEKGLWFRSYYQSVEFTPKELKAQHAQGCYIWGARSWKLFDPKELLRDPEKEKRVAEEHNKAILARMKR